MIWFTADTHFGHSNSLGGNQRPFDTIGQMNARLITAINDRVSSRDTLYMLGDFSYRTSVADALRLRERINCEHVRLIRGNHDKDWGLLEPPVRDAARNGKGRAKKGSAPTTSSVSAVTPGAAAADGPFEAVLDYFELKPGECHGTRMVLSHYPMLSWNGKRRGSIQLHGHIHADPAYNERNRSRGILRYDVGVDANGYAPVSRDDILDFFRGVDPAQIGFAEDEAGAGA
ncbi:metallophosphoesterase [Collinsella sp. D33t1_170424_A12]|uniref:metallophosphoesterase n=1 Tax=Collinsella sp. D33t1_170424_A12 TaxID=2787135 RepID=UPI001E5D36A7|nr:metallophosphoesterase [Collinsella sp. D33t1_170424_A12]